MNDESPYITYDEARTRKIAAEAEIAELELAKIRNDLAIVADVVKAWEDVLAAMKAKLLSVPTKVGPTLAAEDDASVIQSRLEDEIKECLDELSAYDPLSDPTCASISVAISEEGDGDTEAPSKTNGKRVGRPKKTSKLTK